MSAQQHNHDHDHDHDHQHNEAGHSAHDGHDHSGHNHSDHDGHNHGNHDGHNHGNHDGHNHSDHDGHNHAHDAHSGGHDHGKHPSNNFVTDCGSPAKPVHATEYDPAGTAIHHISDANVLTIMDMIRIPLPAIIYNKDRGLEFFSTGKFAAGHHDDGHYGYKDYVLYQGNIHRIKCPSFQGSDHYEVQGFDTGHGVNEAGKEIEKRYAIVNGKGYLIEQKTIWDGGLLGGGVSSFYDFSPTKNVVTMAIV